MTRKFTFLTVLAAMLMSLAMAAPAAAHENTASGRFIGPTMPAEAGGEALNGMQGHQGIQCGAQYDNTPLDPLPLTCKGDA